MGNEQLKCQSFKNPTNKYYSAKTEESNNNMKLDVLKAMDDFKSTKKTNEIFRYGWRIFSKEKKEYSVLKNKVANYFKKVEKQNISPVVMNSISDMILYTQFIHLNFSIYEMQMEYKIDYNLNSVYNKDIFEKNYYIIRDRLFSDLFESQEAKLDFDFFNDEIKSFWEDSSIFSKSELVKQFSEETQDLLLMDEYNNYLYSMRYVSEQDKPKEFERRFINSDKKIIKLEQTVKLPQKKTNKNKDNKFNFKSKTNSKDTKKKVEIIKTENLKGKKVRNYSEYKQNTLKLQKIKKTPKNKKSVPFLTINNNQINKKVSKNKNKQDNESNHITKITYESKR